MKKATQAIMERFPLFQEHFAEHKKPMSSEKDEEPSFYIVNRKTRVEDFDAIQRTFYDLACFFEDPEHHSFDLRLLYQNLDNDWLEWALQIMTLYFREDTYLIEKPSFSIVRESDEYMSQSQFADVLASHDLNYNRRKLNVYYKRGKLPEPDQMFAEKPYWLRSTVESFCEQEKRRVNAPENGRS